MRIELLGCPIDAISMEETLNSIDNAILNQYQLHHVVVNVAKLVHMQTDKVLTKSVIDCDIINADGQGIVWGARFLGKRIPERVAGIDLMIKLIELAAQKKYTIFFLGATREVVESVVEKTKIKYGSDIVAGYRDGYFKDHEQISIAKEIASVKPNILFVAMSSPKKENFLFHNKDLFKNINLIMGVGGSFDVVAGKVKRAPVWMQQYGLEWLYRLIQEPRRMFYRYFSTNLKFILLLVQEKMRF